MHLFSKTKCTRLNKNYVTKFDKKELVFQATVWQSLRNTSPHLADYCYEARILDINLALI